MLMILLPISNRHSVKLQSKRICPACVFVCTPECIFDLPENIHGADF